MGDRVLLANRRSRHVVLGVRHVGRPRDYGSPRLVLRSLLGRGAAMFGGVPARRIFMNIIVTHYWCSCALIVSSSRTIVSTIKQAHSALHGRPRPACQSEESSHRSRCASLGSSTRLRLPSAGPALPSWTRSRDVVWWRSRTPPHLYEYYCYSLLVLLCTNSE